MAMPIYKVLPYTMIYHEFCAQQKYVFPLAVVTCPPLIDPENAMVTFGLNVGDSATYMCNDSLYLRGEYDQD